MKHIFQLINLPEADGEISLARFLAFDLWIKKVVIGSISQRLTGISTVFPKDVSQQKLLESITISDLRPGSTIITMVDRPLLDVISGHQMSFLNEYEGIKDETPITLAFKAIDAATNLNGNHDLLDADLVKDIKGLKHVIKAGESLKIVNESLGGSINFNSESLNMLAKVEAITTQPRLEIVAGILDVFKFSDSQIGLLTNNGMAICKVSPEVRDNHIANIGKMVLAQGKAFFKPNGKLAYLEAEKLTIASDTEKVFNRLPENITTHRALAKELATKKANPIPDIVGTWPGDETDVEFEQMLKSLD